MKNFLWLCIVLMCLISRVRFLGEFSGFRCLVVIVSIGVWL